MNFEVTPERQKRKVYDQAEAVGKDYYTLDDFFDCIRAEKRWAPKSLPLTVSSRFVNADQVGYVTILVVPTAIRAVYNEALERSEHEFEGWLLGDYPHKIYVLGSLQNDNDSDRVTGIYLCQLEPGEETSSFFNPLVAER